MYCLLYKQVQSATAPYAKCAACHLHVTCILLGKTCIMTVRCMLHTCYMHVTCRAKMHVWTCACHMHGQDMLCACHQMTHVICILHAYNMRLPCACQMHVGENRSSYEGVITSELIFLIPIYVWADCVTSPSHISIFSKIGKKLNSEQKTSTCCVHVKTCTQHAHVICMLSVWNTSQFPAYDMYLTWTKW